MICQNNRVTAELQLKQLEILRELDRVCRICGVKYFLSTGSCLGAVRHKGFIPWDDDIDVYLMWYEAEKLLQNKELFGKDFFLQCKKTDKNLQTTSYRLKDNRTSYFLKEEIGLDINHGIGIDIYLLYPFPDEYFYAHKLIIESFIYRILSNGVAPKNHGKLSQLIGNIILAFYKGKRREKKEKKILKEYTGNGGQKYVATYFGEDVGFYSAIVYPKELFKKQCWMKFEDMMAPCPADPERYCEIRYGKSYMTLPPEEKRISKHDYVFASVNEPYINYKGKYY